MKILFPQGKEKGTWHGVWFHPSQSNRAGFGKGRQSTACCARLRPQFLPVRQVCCAGVQPRNRHLRQMLHRPPRFAVLQWQFFATKRQRLLQAWRILFWNAVLPRFHQQKTVEKSADTWRTGFPLTHRVRFFHFEMSVAKLVWDFEKLRLMQAICLQIKWRKGTI